MIWHGYDLSALLFLAPFAVEPATAEWFFGPERARRCCRNEVHAARRS